ncbi:MAG: DUF3040 domain-containing protein [Dermatophilaceae bacterium]
MALSEHEEALLQQMEEALYAEDPQFASRIEKTKSHSAHRGRVVIGVGGALVGLALVVLAAWTSYLWLGAIGFAFMVAGIAYAVSPGKPRLGTVAEDGTIRHPVKGKPGSTGKSPTPGKTGSLMERIEERWERRHRDQ